MKWSSLMESINTLIENISTFFARLFNEFIPSLLVNIFGFFPIIFFAGLILLTLYLTKDVREKLKQTTPQNRSSIKVDKNYKTKTVPLKGHLPSIYIFYSYIYGISPFKDDRGKILAAYLTNWLMDGHIDYKLEEKDGLFKGDYVKIIFLEDKTNFTYESEKTIYENLRSLGENNSFTGKDLVKDIGKNTSKYREYEESLIEEGINFSISNGYLYRDEKDYLYLSDDGIEEYKDLKGLNNYLDEIGDIDEEILASRDKFIQLINVTIILDEKNNVVKLLEEKHPSYKLTEDRTIPAYKDIRNMLQIAWRANSQYNSSIDT